MLTITRYVGLDVHKNTISIAICGGSGDARFIETIPHDMPLLLKHLKKHAENLPIRVGYEAGPTGYGLHRFLTQNKIECVVVPPSSVPKQSLRRVKTDRRDARAIAVHLRSGAFRAVLVPDPESEAIRDLGRAREDARNALGRAKRHLLSFLLRHGRSFDGKTNWTKAHVAWIGEQKFEHEAHTQVATDYLNEVVHGQERLKNLGKQLATQVEKWKKHDLVIALRALRGIDTLTATLIVAEIIDFTRFPHPRQLMGFVGLVPSESSSGNTVRRGGITKMGNPLIRRLLVEAAWKAQISPRLTKALLARLELVSPEVRAIAEKARHRLHQRYQALSARKMSLKKVTTAIARELLGFIWAVATAPRLLAA